MWLSLRSRLLSALSVSVTLALAPAVARAACTVTEGDFDQSGLPDLKLLGSALPQTAEFTLASGHLYLNLDCNGDGDFVDAGERNAWPVPDGTETLILDLKGKDTIRFTFGGNNGHLKLNPVIVLGPGPNRVETRVQDNLSINGLSSVVFDITGGPGVDVVDFGMTGGTTSELRDSAFVVRADLGAGDDRFGYSPFVQVSHSDLELDVALGLGKNWAWFNHANLSNGSWARFDVQGGDVATNATTNTPYDQVGTGFYYPIGVTCRLQFNANLRNGNDIFEANLDHTFSVVVTSNVTIRAAGGLGNDTLSVGDMRDILGNSGMLDVNLNGGPGADSLALGLSGVASFGTARLRADGGEGNDVVAASLINDPNNTGLGNALDINLRGGAGQDLLFSAVSDPNASGSLGPAGAVVLNGGPGGSDLCSDYDGPAAWPATEKPNCELGN